MYTGNNNLNKARNYFESKVEEIKLNGGNFIDADFSYEYGILSRKKNIIISEPFSFIQTYAKKLPGIYNGEVSIETLDQEIAVVKDAPFENIYELSEITLCLTYLIQVCHFAVKKTSKDLENCYYLFERVTTAIGRKNIMMDYTEFCLNNWKLIDESKPISVNNVEMRYRIFNNETERLLQSATVTMEYESSKLYLEMFNCIDDVIENNNIKLAEHLENLIKIMIKFSYIFCSIMNNPKRGKGCPFSFKRQENKEFDTYAWGISFFKIANAYNEDHKRQSKSADFSGSNSTNINILDTFINKPNNSQWGRRTERAIENQTISLKNFVLSFKDSPNVFDYIQNSNNDEIKVKMKLFLYFYASDYGFLGKHLPAAVDAYDVNFQVIDQSNKFNLNKMSTKIKAFKKGLLHTIAERGEFDSTFFYGKVLCKKLYEKNNEKLALSLKISVPGSSALMLKPGDCVEFSLYNRNVDNNLENLIKDIIKGDTITLDDEDLVLKCLKLRNFIEDNNDLNLIDKKKDADFYGHYIKKTYKILISKFLMLINLDSSKLILKLLKLQVINEAFKLENSKSSVMDILQKIIDLNQENKIKLADEKSDLFIGKLFSFIEPKLVSLNRIHDQNTISILKTKTKDCNHLYDGFNLMDSLHTNDIVILRPYKNYKENIERIYEDDNLTLIVSSGSGFSPALSILEEFNNNCNNKNAKIIFIYICRYFEQTFNKKVLVNISNNKNIELKIIFTQEKQQSIEQIHDFKLKSTIDKLNNKIIFSNGDRNLLYKVITNTINCNNEYKEFKNVNFIFSGVIDLVNNLKRFALTDETMSGLLKNKDYKFFDEFMHKEVQIDHLEQKNINNDNTHNHKQFRNVKYSEFFKQSNSRKYWTIVNDDVLDLRSYLNNHPGMSKIIERHTGLDMSLAWKNFNHDKLPKVNYMMNSFTVGKIQNELCSDDIYNSLVNLGYTINLLENTIHIVVEVRDEHNQYLAISSFVEKCLSNHKLKVFVEIEELKNKLKNNQNYAFEDQRDIVNNIEDINLQSLHREEDDPKVYTLIDQLEKLRINNVRLLNLVSNSLSLLENNSKESFIYMFSSIGLLQDIYLK